MNWQEAYILLGVAKEARQYPQLKVVHDGAIGKLSEMGAELEKELAEAAKEKAEAQAKADAEAQKAKQAEAEQAESAKETKMPRDILSEYGSDSTGPQRPRATSGGCTEAKPLPYSPPVGPSGINDSKTPGIHGMNHGNCGSQGKG